MELILGAIVIIVLLLILGVPWILIVEVIIGLMVLLLIVMFVFFVVTLILVALSRPVKGKFLRIFKHEVVGTYAIYEIDGEEYKNTFPAEIMFVDRIYHEGQIYPLRFHKSKKGYMSSAWDWCCPAAVWYWHSGCFRCLQWAMYDLERIKIYGELCSDISDLDGAAD
jgi:hypothetical protein